MTKSVSPLGRFVFGALNQPRTNNFGKTEWSCGLQLSTEEGEPLLTAIEQTLAAKRKGDPRFPQKNDNLRMPYRPSRSKDESGEYIVDPNKMIWVFNRNYEIKRNGEPTRNTPPLIYDSTGRLVEDLGHVGFGSMIKVVYDIYCYSQPGGNGGVKLDLLGFQIASLKENVEELAPIEGGWVAETTPAEDIASILASA
jgi:hypothetical protein